MRAPKKNFTRGYTLFETAIALGLWLFLMSAILFLWQFSAQNGARLFEQQNTFENARIAADALVMNLQTARKISLTTDKDGVLVRLTAESLNPSGNFHPFFFEFDAKAAQLYFGNNEFASHIAEIKILYENNLMKIFLQTTCSEPTFLRATADVRYKYVSVNE